MEDCFIPVDGAGVSRVRCRCRLLFGIGYSSRGLAGQGSDVNVEFTVLLAGRSSEWVCFLYLTDSIRLPN